LVGNYKTSVAFVTKYCSYYLPSYFVPMVTVKGGMVTCTPIVVVDIYNLWEQRIMRLSTYYRTFSLTNGSHLG